MASKSLEQGIHAIQQQDMAQGKRLIKYALKNDALSADERIKALIWLAETDNDIEFKLAQYQQAVQIDPSNEDTLNRLLHWKQRQQQAQNMPAPRQQQQNMGYTPTNPTVPPGETWQDPSQQLLNMGYTPTNPTVPRRETWQDPAQQQFNQGYTPADPQSQWYEAMQKPLQQNINAMESSPYHDEPLHIQTIQHVVQITGGLNGVGSGFFVTRDGLIATTRYVVGGQREVTVTLLDGQQLSGQVVRAFIEFDLVFVKVPARVEQLLRTLQSSIIPDNTPLAIVAYPNQGVESAKRRSINEIEQHWFPTMANQLKDAGGNPVFDRNNNILVGMMTNNASRSNGYFYGLYIHKIYECVEYYVYEVGQHQGRNTEYCATCGVISIAPTMGGYFCEHCGNVLPYALNIQRAPQPELARLYGETERNPCPNCGSQAGFHGRDCLRCGYQL
ncbi:MAG: trypsin-like peptidase domain-containing protein [Anaerolineae bacterium]